MINSLSKYGVFNKTVIIQCLAKVYNSIFTTKLIAKILNQIIYIEV